MKKASIAAIGLLGITSLTAHFVTESGSKASNTGESGEVSPRVEMTQSAPKSSPETSPETSPKTRKTQGSEQQQPGAPANGAPQAAQRAAPPGTTDQVFVRLAEKVVPSVVNISTVSDSQGMGPHTEEEEFFRRFFEDFFGPGGPGVPGGPGMPGTPGMPPDGRQAMSLGTGFVIDASGLILTNNHVVAEADKIFVSFQADPSNGVQQELTGEVVGRDPELDIALIRVDTDMNLRALPFGNSDDLKVGEYVAAVGNPFGQGHSVTHGIISAKGRLSPDFPLLTYLQTDAPINPGNSGGPLVNLNGEVIGINNAILAQAQGIGFAIPADPVQAILPQLTTKGVVTRGYIGVLINEMSPQIANQLDVPEGETSPFITHVYPDSPADRAGLQPYDVIQQFGGRPIDSGSDLLRAVTDVPVGSETEVVVTRDGKKREVDVQVTERPGAERLAEREDREDGQEEDPAESPAGGTGLKVENLTPQLAARLGLPPNSDGVVVTEILPGGPADEAGLFPGDVILDVDQKEVDSVEAFRSAIRNREAHLLRIQRPTPDGDPAVAVVVLDLQQEEEAVS